MKRFRRRLLLLFLFAACAADEEPRPGPTTETSHAELAAVAHSAASFVAVGGIFGLSGQGPAEAQIVSSPDGDSWTITRFEGMPPFRAVAAGGTRWVVAGGDPREGGPSMLVSDDGATWRAPQTPPSALVSGIAHGNGLFVAIGEQDNHNVVLVSSDAEQWQTTELGSHWWDPRIVFAHGRFIISGNGSTLASSSDGQTWTFIDTGLTAVTAVVGIEHRTLGLALYDCCFGEEPDLQQLFVLERQPNDTWSVDEVANDPRVVELVAVDTGLQASLVGRGHDALYQLSGTDVHSWTWSRTTDEPSYVSDIVANDQGTVVAVGTKIMVSHDGGASWTHRGVH